MTFRYAKKLKRRWEHEYENHKAPVLDFTGPKNFMSNDWNFLAVGSTRRWLPYFTFNTSVALWCWPFIQCNVGIKHGLLNVNIRLWFRPSLRGICNLQIIMWMTFTECTYKIIIKLTRLRSELELVRDNVGCWVSFGRCNARVMFM